MIRLVIDTHAIIWYAVSHPRLSRTASDAIEEIVADGHHIGYSAISLVELVYLFEKDRLEHASAGPIADLLRRTDCFAEIPIDRKVVDALTTIVRSDVPDMPDRIIAASASMLGVPLVSRDRKIRASGLATIW